MGLLTWLMTAGKVSVGHERLEEGREDVDA